MTPLWSRTASALCLVACVLAACSPALNWREVHLNGLQTMLPCKPDHAQRTMPLGAQNRSMEMVGCEASGALYAVSHVRVDDPRETADTQSAWRAAMLSNFQGTTFQAQPYQLAKSRAVDQPKGLEPLHSATGTGLEILAVEGTGPDGRALQARWLWIANGVDIYLVVVYAPTLSPDMLEMVFSSLAIP